MQFFKFKTPKIFHMVRKDAHMWQLLQNITTCTNVYPVPIHEKRIINLLSTLSLPLPQLVLSSMFKDVQFLLLLTTLFARNILANPVKTIPFQLYGDDYEASTDGWLYFNVTRGPSYDPCLEAMAPPTYDFAVHNDTDKIPLMVHFREYMKGLDNDGKTELFSALRYYGTYKAAEELVKNNTTTTDIFDSVFDEMIEDGVFNNFPECSLYHNNQTTTAGTSTDFTQVQKEATFDFAPRCDNNNLAGFADCETASSKIDITRSYAGFHISSGNCILQAAADNPLISGSDVRKAYNTIKTNCLSASNWNFVSGWTSKKTDKPRICLSSADSCKDKWDY
ncbi:unnamed protein product [Ambrosiozyma monospora]|uniref:Unnamed protein product n=1 Tax=Ambrosiozyma monospora TaxID=43982 RepID=A0A9W6YRX4_AMBMO|nr:unnamed protein product [Ambrosiozyma monospora]